MLLTIDDMRDEMNKRKEQEALAAEQPAPEQAPQPAQSPPSLLAMPEKPVAPFQQLKDEHGTGGAIMRLLGTGLSGGLLGGALVPELQRGNQMQYASDLKAYNETAKVKQMTEALNGLDPSEITAGHVALATEYGGSELGGYYADQFAAQQNASGGDQAIAESFGYNPYQWSQLGDVAQRGMRNQYRQKNGDDGYFDAQLMAEGKAPEQLGAAKSAELFGSAEGQQYGDDRQSILNIQGQVLAADQQLESLGEIRKDLAKPGATGLTGWPRVVRNFLNANNYTDGAMDAEMATGVVDLISQATFGALSQSELDLLKGGLMDPTKSMEYNLGTLDQATKRIENERELALDGARGAADRYKNWKGQKDYDKLFKNDWLYQNVGAGSRIQPIPAFGGAEEYTFQKYVEETMSNLSPFAQKPSRDQLVNGFAKERELAEESYNTMIEERRLEEEAAKAAQERLQKPFGTKK